MAGHAAPINITGSFCMTTISAEGQKTTFSSGLPKPISAKERRVSDGAGVQTKDFCIQLTDISTVLSTVQDGKGNAASSYIAKSADRSVFSLDLRKTNFLGPAAVVRKKVKGVASGVTGGGPSPNTITTTAQGNTAIDVKKDSSVTEKLPSVNQGTKLSKETCDSSSKVVNTECKITKKNKNTGKDSKKMEKSPRTAISPLSPTRQSSDRASKSKCVAFLKDVTSSIKKKYHPTPLTNDGVEKQQKSDSKKCNYNSVKAGTPKSPNPSTNRVKKSVKKSVKNVSGDSISVQETSKKVSLKSKSVQKESVLSGTVNKEGTASTNNVVNKDLKQYPIRSQLGSPNRVNNKVDDNSPVRVAKEKKVETKGANIKNPTAAVVDLKSNGEKFKLKERKKNRKKNSKGIEDKKLATDSNTSQKQNCDNQTGKRTNQVKKLPEIGSTAIVQKTKLKGLKMRNISLSEKTGAIHMDKQEPVNLDYKQCVYENVENHQHDLDKKGSCSSGGHTPRSDGYNSDHYKISNKRRYSSETSDSEDNLNRGKRTLNVPKWKLGQQNIKTYDSFESRINLQLNLGRAKRTSATEKTIGFTNYSDISGGELDQRRLVDKNDESESQSPSSSDDEYADDDDDGYTSFDEEGNVLPVTRKQGLSQAKIPKINLQTGDKNLVVTDKPEELPLCDETNGDKEGEKANSNKREDTKKIAKEPSESDPVDFEKNVEAVFGKRSDKFLSADALIVSPVKKLTEDDSSDDANDDVTDLDSSSDIIDLLPEGTEQTNRASTPSLNFSKSKKPTLLFDNTTNPEEEDDENSNSVGDEPPILENELIHRPKSTTSSKTSNVDESSNFEAPILEPFEGQTVVTDDNMIIGSQQQQLPVDGDDSNMFLVGDGDCEKEEKNSDRLPSLYAIDDVNDANGNTNSTNTDDIHFSKVNVAASSEARHSIEGEEQNTVCESTAVEGTLVDDELTLEQHDEELCGATGVTEAAGFFGSDGGRVFATEGYVTTEDILAAADDNGVVVVTDGNTVVSCKVQTVPDDKDIETFLSENSDNSEMPPEMIVVNSEPILIADGVQPRFVEDVNLLDTGDGVINNNYVTSYITGGGGNYEDLLEPIQDSENDSFEMMIDHTGCDDDNIIMDFSALPDYEQQDHSQLPDQDVYQVNEEIPPMLESKIDENKSRIKRKSRIQELKSAGENSNHDSSSDDVIEVSKPQKNKQVELGLNFNEKIKKMGAAFKNNKSLNTAATVAPLTLKINRHTDTAIVINKSSGESTPVEAEMSPITEIPNSDITTELLNGGQATTLAERKEKLRLKKEEKQKNKSTKRFDNAFQAAFDMLNKALKNPGQRDPNDDDQSPVSETSSFSSEVSSILGIKLPEIACNSKKKKADKVNDNTKAKTVKPSQIKKPVKRLSTEQNKTANKRNPDDCVWYPYENKICYVNGLSTAKSIRQTRNIATNIEGKVRVLKQDCQEHDLTMVGQEKLVVPSMSPKDLIELKEQVVREVAHNKKEAQLRQDEAIAKLLKDNKSDYTEVKQGKITENMGKQQKLLSPNVKMLKGNLSGSERGHTPFSEGDSEVSDSEAAVDKAVMNKEAGNQSGSDKNISIDLRGVYTCKMVAAGGSQENGSRSSSNSSFGDVIKSGVWTECIEMKRKEVKASQAFEDKASLPVNVSNNSNSEVYHSNGDSMDTLDSDLAKNKEAPKACLEHVQKKSKERLERKSLDFSSLFGSGDGVLITKDPKKVLLSNSKQKHMLSESKDRIEKSKDSQSEARSGCSDKAKVTESPLNSEEGESITNERLKKTDEDQDKKHKKKTDGSNKAKDKSTNKPRSSENTKHSIKELPKEQSSENKKSHNNTNRSGSTDKIGQDRKIKQHLPQNESNNSHVMTNRNDVCDKDNSKRVLSVVEDKLNRESKSQEKCHDVEQQDAEISKTIQSKGQTIQIVPTAEKEVTIKNNDKNISKREDSHDDSLKQDSEKNKKSKDRNTSRISSSSESNNSTEKITVAYKIPEIKPKCIEAKTSDGNNFDKKSSDKSDRKKSESKKEHCSKKEDSHCDSPKPDSETDKTSKATEKITVADKIPEIKPKGIEAKTSDGNNFDKKSSGKSDRKKSESKKEHSSKKEDSHCDSPKPDSETDKTLKATEKITVADKIPEIKPKGIEAKTSDGNNYDKKSSDKSGRKMIESRKEHSSKKEDSHHDSPKPDSEKNKTSKEGNTSRINSSSENPSESNTSTEKIKGADKIKEIKIKGIEAKTSDGKNYDKKSSDKSDRKKSESGKENISKRRDSHRDSPKPDSEKTKISKDGNTSRKNSNSENSKTSSHQKTDSENRGSNSKQSSSSKELVDKKRSSRDHKYEKKGGDKVRSSKDSLKMEKNDHKKNAAESHKNKKSDNQKEEKSLKSKEKDILKGETSKEKGATASKDANKTESEKKITENIKSPKHSSSHCEKDQKSSKDTKEIKSSKKIMSNDSVEKSKNIKENYVIRISDKDNSESPQTSAQMQKASMVGMDPPKLDISQNSEFIKKVESIKESEKSMRMYTKTIGSDQDGGITVNLSSIEVDECSVKPSTEKEINIPDNEVNESTIVHNSQIVLKVLTDKRQENLQKAVEEEHAMRDTSVNLCNKKDKGHFADNSDQNMLKDNRQVITEKSNDKVSIDIEVSAKNLISIDDKTIYPVNLEEKEKQNNVIEDQIYDKRLKENSSIQETKTLLNAVATEDRLSQSVSHGTKEQDRKVTNKLNSPHKLIIHKNTLQQGNNLKDDSSKIALSEPTNQKEMSFEDIDTGSPEAAINAILQISADKKLKKQNLSINNELSFEDHETEIEIPVSYSTEDNKFPSDNNIEDCADEKMKQSSLCEKPLHVQLLRTRGDSQCSSRRGSSTGSEKSGSSENGDGVGDVDFFSMLATNFDDIGGNHTDDFDLHKQLHTPPLLIDNGDRSHAKESTAGAASPSTQVMWKTSEKRHHKSKKKHAARKMNAEDKQDLPSVDKAHSTSVEKSHPETVSEKPVFASDERTGVDKADTAAIEKRNFGIVEKTDSVHVEKGAESFGKADSVTIEKADSARKEKRDLDSLRNTDSVTIKKVESVSVEKPEKDDSVCVEKVVALKDFAFDKSETEVSSKANEEVSQISSNAVASGENMVRDDTTCKLDMARISETKDDDKFVISPTHALQKLNSTEDNTCIKVHESEIDTKKDKPKKTTNLEYDTADSVVLLLPEGPDEFDEEMSYKSCAKLSAKVMTDYLNVEPYTNKSDNEGNKEYTGNKNENDFDLNEKSNAYEDAVSSHVSDNIENEVDQASDKIDKTKTSVTCDKEEGEISDDESNDAGAINTENINEDDNVEKKSSSKHRKRHKHRHRKDSKERSKSSRRIREHDGGMLEIEVQSSKKSSSHRHKKKDKRKHSRRKKSVDNDELVVGGDSSNESQDRALRNSADSRSTSIDSDDVQKEADVESGETSAFAEFLKKKRKMNEKSVGEGSVSPPKKHSPSDDCILNDEVINDKNEIDTETPIMDSESADNKIQLKKSSSNKKKYPKRMDSAFCKPSGSRKRKITEKKKFKQKLSVLHQATLDNLKSDDTSSPSSEHSNEQVVSIRSLAEKSTSEFHETTVDSSPDEGIYMDNSDPPATVIETDVLEGKIQAEKLISEFVIPHIEVFNNQLGLDEKYADTMFKLSYLSPIYDGGMNSPPCASSPTHMTTESDSDLVYDGTEQKLLYKIQEDSNVERKYLSTIHILEKYRCSPLPKLNCEKQGMSLEEMSEMYNASITKENGGTDDDSSAMEIAESANQDEDLITSVLVAKLDQEITKSSEAKNNSVAGGIKEIPFDMQESKNPVLEVERSSSVNQDSNFKKPFSVQEVSVAVVKKGKNVMPTVKEIPFDIQVPAVIEIPADIPEPVVKEISIALLEPAVKEIPIDIQDTVSPVVDKEKEAIVNVQKVKEIPEIMLDIVSSEPSVSVAKSDDHQHALKVKEIPAEMQEIETEDATGKQLVSGTDKTLQPLSAFKSYGLGSDIKNTQSQKAFSPVKVISTIIPEIPSSPIAIGEAENTDKKKVSVSDNNNKKLSLKEIPITMQTVSQLNDGDPKARAVKEIPIIHVEEKTQEPASNDSDTDAVSKLTAMKKIPTDIIEIEDASKSNGEVKAQESVLCKSVVDETAVTEILTDTKDKLKDPVLQVEKENNVLSSSKEDDELIQIESEKIEQVQESALINQRSPVKTAQGFENKEVVNTVYDSNSNVGDSKPSAVPRGSEGDSKPSAVPKGSEGDSKPSAVPKGSEGDSKPSAVPKGSEGDSKPSAVPKDSEGDSKPSAVPKGSEGDSKPSAVPRGSEGDSKPSAVPRGSENEGIHEAIDEALTSPVTMDVAPGSPVAMDESPNSPVAMDESPDSPVADTNCEEHENDSIKSPAPVRSLSRGSKSIPSSPISSPVQSPIAISSVPEEGSEFVGKAAIVIPLTITDFDPDTEEYLQTCKSEQVLLEKNVAEENQSLKRKSSVDENTIKDSIDNESSVDESHADVKRPKLDESLHDSQSSQIVSSQNTTVVESSKISLPVKKRNMYYNDEEDEGIKSVPFRPISPYNTTTNMVSSRKKDKVASSNQQQHSSQVSHNNKKQISSTVEVVHKNKKQISSTVEVVHKNKSSDKSALKRPSSSCSKDSKDSSDHYKPSEKRRSNSKKRYSSHEKSSKDDRDDGGNEVYEKRERDNRYSDRHYDDYPHNKKPYSKPHSKDLDNYRHSDRGHNSNRHSAHDYDRDYREEERHDPDYYRHLDRPQTSHCDDYREDDDRDRYGSGHDPDYYHRDKDSHYRHDSHEYDQYRDREDLHHHQHHQYDEDRRDEYSYPASHYHRDYYEDRHDKKDSGYSDYHHPHHHNREEDHHNRNEDHHHRNEDHHHRDEDHHHRDEVHHNRDEDHHDYSNHRSRYEAEHSRQSDRYSNHSGSDKDRYYSQNSSKSDKYSSNREKDPRRSRSSSYRKKEEDDREYYNRSKKDRQSCSSSGGNSNKKGEDNENSDNSSRTTKKEKSNGSVSTIARIQKRSDTNQPNRPCIISPVRKPPGRALVLDDCIHHGAPS